MKKGIIIYCKIVRRLPVYLFPNISVSHIFSSFVRYERFFNPGVVHVCLVVIVAIDIGDESAALAVLPFLPYNAGNCASMQLSKLSYVIKL